MSKAPIFLMFPILVGSMEIGRIGRIGWMIKIHIFLIFPILTVKLRKMGKFGKMGWMIKIPILPISTIARGIEIDLRQNLGEAKDEIPAQYPVKHHTQF